MRVALAALVLFAAGGAQAAGFDCSRFEHQPDGTWKVVEPLQIRGPRGRIDFTPDEIYKQGAGKDGLGSRQAPGCQLHQEIAIGRE